MVLRSLPPSPDSHLDPEHVANPHELRNRAAKLEALTALLDEYTARLGADRYRAASHVVAILSVANEQAWAGLAVAADVKIPSVETRAELIGIYVERARLFESAKREVAADLGAFRGGR